MLRHFCGRLSDDRYDDPFVEGPRTTSRNYHPSENGIITILVLFVRPVHNDHPLFGWRRDRNFIVFEFSLDASIRFFHVRDDNVFFIWIFYVDCLHLLFHPGGVNDRSFVFATKRK